MPQLITTDTQILSHAHPLKYSHKNIQIKLKLTNLHELKQKNNNIQVRNSEVHQHHSIVDRVHFSPHCSSQHHISAMLRSRPLAKTPKCQVKTQKCNSKELFQKRYKVQCSNLIKVKILADFDRHNCKRWVRIYTALAVQQKGGGVWCIKKFLKIVPTTRQ